MVRAAEPPQSTGLQVPYDEGVKQIKSSPAEAIKIFRDLVLGEHPNDADSLKVKEQAVQQLGELYSKQSEAEAIRSLLTEIRPLFAAFPKARTAKLVRMLIESVAKIPDSTALQMEICKEQAAWASSEKRTFLRQRIELRLAALYLGMKDYAASLSLIGKLLTEVKRLDDKLLLVDVHLVESRVHDALRNQPKAKAALTAARTAANAIYIPPALQAEIDTQSGVLHAEEKDYTTAFSYFFEAFEAHAQLDDPRATFSLKYMLLCKIMMLEAEDVPSIIASKAGLKHSGPDVDAMKAVGKAHQHRSLHEFQATLKSYHHELQEDPIVHTHLAALYDTLLEQNLLRLIEPFSRVEVSHVASLIQLPTETVLTKLSQMILDRKFAGTLDQGAGCLEIFDDPPSDQIYPSALGTFSNMGKVVDALFARSEKIVA